MKKRIFLFIVLIFFASVSVHAETPMESIKKPTEKIINILKLDKYKNLTPDLKEAQWSEIWIIVEKSFNFKIISRLALGKHWKKLRGTQQDEFQVLFSELLANTYINKVQDNFKNQDITYVDEKIADNRAEVLVHVALEDKPVPIVYRLIKTEKWSVFDVKIEGMSMIKNYRSQFDEFLFKNSPDELIKKMGEKIQQLRKQRKTVSPK